MDYYHTPGILIHCINVTYEIRLNLGLRGGQVS